MRDQTIDGKLLFTQNAISNAETVPSIKTALAATGYNDAEMQEGKGLYTRAAVLHTKQKK